MIFFEYEQVISLHSSLIAKLVEWTEFVMLIFWSQHLKHRFKHSVETNFI